MEENFHGCGAQTFEATNLGRFPAGSIRSENVCSTMTNNCSTELLSLDFANEAIRSMTYLYCLSGLTDCNVPCKRLNTKD